MVMCHREVGNPFTPSIPNFRFPKPSISNFRNSAFGVGGGGGG
jgi:hypothetical protein